MSKFSTNPLEDFFNALPTPGAGLYVSPAFEKIKKEYGVDAAKDFLAAYRNNDQEAALRVARKISRDDGCKIGGSSLGFVFDMAGEQHKIVPPKPVVGPEGFDGYRSEAHAVLGASLMLRLKLATQKQSLEEEYKVNGFNPAGVKIF
jgi:hypothetical protein